MSTYKIAKADKATMTYLVLTHNVLNINKSMMALVAYIYEIQKEENAGQ